MIWIDLKESRRYKQDTKPNEFCIKQDSEDGRRWLQKLTKEHDRVVDIENLTVEIVKFKLDENGERYSHYKTTPNEEGIFEPDLVKIEADNREKEKDEAYRRVNDEYAEAIGKLTAGVPSEEVSTWAKQELEARAWKSDSAAKTPLIDALVKARGVKKEVLVGKILGKADMYAVAVGMATGARQKAEDELGKKYE